LNLSHEKVQEINRLLLEEAKNLPSFRQEVNVNGHNYLWLQKNILKKNSTISIKLKELLEII